MSRLAIGRCWPIFYGMDNKDKWISAFEAYARVQKVTNSDVATREAICTRAHEGIVKARAKIFIIGNHQERNCDVPHEFWWARGKEALEQNWAVGDFITWIKYGSERKALGVEFLESDIEDMIPCTTIEPKSRKGRAPAIWWEDCLIAMFVAIYSNDLKLNKQADLEKAMADWISINGHSATDSTVRIRASKLWKALQN